MLRRTVLLLASCLVFAVFPSFAQQFGGNPSATRWRQINSDTARIIFPEGLDSVAQRIANVTHVLQEHYTTGIGSNLRKVSIVLQKDLTVSNAFVQLGPYRSEYYLMPPQDAFDLGAQGWADNLAIHEFRHVQQYSNFNVGLSKVFSVLFGQYGQSVANSAAIPDWFFEGDAVYNETKLSIQGRGRLPLFLNSYKTLTKDNRHYNYMQLRNGSLRHYIPGHYELGYLLAAYGREKYGDDFWQKVTHDAAAYKPLFYPMQGSVKKYAGISYDRFVQDAFNYYYQQWQQDATATAATWLTPAKKHDVLNYQYPYIINDGTVIALKTTRSAIPAFYRIDTAGNETKIAVRDIAYDSYFSCNNNTIVYAALQADARWGNRDYSVIKTLDITTGTERKITTRSKYFAPDISHDGKTIAAVEYTPDQQSTIVLLDTEGAVLQAYTAQSGHVFSYPKFSAGDQSLFFIERNQTGEMALLKKKLSGGKPEVLLPFSNRIIGFPVVMGDTLLYTCSNNGHDEIFAYTETGKKHYRLASYQTGLYQAGINSKGAVITAVFTSSGYRLASFVPQWHEIKTGSDTLTPQLVSKPFSIKDNRLLQHLPERDFTVKKYPKLYRPFNFHSWVPSFSDPDYSFTVYGENVLNTLQSQLYYTYNANERYHRAGFNTTFGGWYIQPFIELNETFARSGIINDSIGIKWNELLATAGLRLPLNFTGGNQFRSLIFSASYNINNIQWKSDNKKLLNDLNYFRATISYSGQIQKAAKQIYPHWGQAVSLQYRASITAITAMQLLATGNLYLPGFGKTHSIVLNAAYQARDTAQQYAYTNSFPYSRGYNTINYPRMWKLGVNYHFPLFYPDWGFANIVYFTRIRANLFYDYTTLRSLRLQTNYQLRSYGAEIYFDTKWWNQQPLQFGIRYSRLADNKLTGLQPNRWEIILPVTLIN